MNILENIDKISYKKIVSFGLLLAIVTGLPVGTYLVSRNQAEYKSSHAAYEKPKPVEKVKATPGPAPTEKPVLGRVFPWAGKEGDIVWIQGKHFGINPQDKSLTIAGVKLDDMQIDAWQDDLIQAVIPKGARQGGVVELKIGDYPVVRSLPMIIYDADTSLRLHKRGNRIVLTNATKDIDKAIIWTGDDEIPTEQHESSLSVDSQGEAFVFDTQNKPILSILIVNKAGHLMDYIPDPIEFDF